MFMCGVFAGIIIGFGGAIVWGIHILKKERESDAETIRVDFSDGSTGKYVRKEW